MLSAEHDLLRSLVAECEADIQAGTTLALPGNALFLSDGRVLCRERSRGDSRYPYGSDGFNFWVSASGLMHGNRGLFYLFLPAHNGQDPPIAFLAGCRVSEEKDFVSHSLLPVPYIHEGETRGIRRYTVIGHDATYFGAESPELSSLVRVFVDQRRPTHAHLHFSVYLQPKTDRTLSIRLSSYMNPFCRHQFSETSEDRWFKKISVRADEGRAVPEGDGKRTSGVILPPFIIQTSEDVSRFRSISNFALVRRSVCLRRVGADAEMPLRVRHDDADQIDSASDSLAGEIAVQECTSRLGYVGSPRRSLGTAKFLTSGRLDQNISVTAFNDNAIVGDLLRLQLPGESYLRADYVFSVPEDSRLFDRELGHSVGPDEVDHALREVRKTVMDQGQLRMEVRQGLWPELPSDTFNRFVPFLKKQVAVCALIKGYMHLSPFALIGFRDVFQAVEGHLFDKPGEARVRYWRRWSMCSSMGAARGSIPFR